MKRPSLPTNEAERLNALRDHRILDTLPEQVFDDLAQLAAVLTDMPIALISLIDADRQWLKSKFGLEGGEVPREVAFCSHVVADGKMMCVEDATVDPRFADNPLVVGEPGVRFYAGAPLTTSGGYTLGTICVADRVPRTLSASKLEMLQALARQVVSQLELRLANFATKAAARKHELYFEMSLDMLCIAGVDGYFKELNPAWSEVLGFSVGELTSKPFVEFVHPDDRASTVTETIALASGEYKTVNFENRYGCKDGSYRWLRWTATADPESEIILAAARDVTHQKRIEGELRAATQAAEEANKTKSAFLANMSHELRTPLNSVIGFTGILAKNGHGNLRDQDLNYLDRILTNGKHLLTMLNDILDLSKIEAGKVDFSPVPIALETVAMDVLQSMEDQALSRGVALAFSHPPKLDMIEADPRRLKQVLINLLGNALKFGEGGTVELKIVTAPDSNRPTRIDVIDGGIGINPEKLELIFEPFRQADDTTSRSFGGTGLGLPIALSMCREMGFRLVVDSRLNAGSTFSILLSDDAVATDHNGPSSDSIYLRRPASDERPPGTGKRRERNTTLLVIDDDADSRMVLERYLEDWGCTVVTASSGRNALELAKTVDPALITLDLMMPGVDGWQVLEQLKNDEELKDIPVVICSVVGNENRASLAHATDIIDKPVDRDQLAAILTRELGARQRKVLVIEDDQDAREILGGIITNFGGRFRVAADGEQALDTLEEFSPDLIVLDLMMPVMDGFELLEAIRQDPRHRHRPVVIFTAKDLSQEERERLNDVQGVVQKGDDDKLRDTLDDLLS